MYEVVYAEARDVQTFIGWRADSRSAGRSRCLSVYDAKKSKHRQSDIVKHYGNPSIDGQTLIGRRAGIGKAGRCRRAFVCDAENSIRDVIVVL